MIATMALALLFIEKPVKPPPPPETEEIAPERETAAAFVKVRRIYVDILTGGESALRIRDMLMSSIQATKLFIVTEEEEKADAVLKGAGHDQAFTDVFNSSDNINAHSSLSIPGFGGNSGITTSAAAAQRQASDRITTSIGAGESENQKIEERKHEAMAAVRLVDKDGDVIWSATEESLGAKFAGASVDVVDRITKKLAADFRKAKAEAKPVP
ncbi:MAG: hypothetical protein ABSH09_04035 [Bryobacteraceae bacterium]|jgi:hypothetical protein